MAQQSNEHLTIAELSAYIDEELAPEELALCDAHIQTCQPCQAALADLRLTCALLASMPQVAVPRSFVLPTNLALLPETPAITTAKPAERAPTRHTHILQRSLRAVSTLVAILGVLFFLAGASSMLAHGGASNSSATMSNAAVPHAASGQITPTSTPLIANTPVQRLSPDVRTTPHATSQLTPAPVPTPTSTPTTYANSQTQDQPPAQQPELPAALDPGQPVGRLSIGAALLLLSILGALASRWLNRASRH